MEVKKAEHIDIMSENTVTVVKAGYITKVRFMTGYPSSTIQKISKHLYVNKQTGEVKEYNHNNTTRVENVENVKKTFENIRMIINANVTQPYKCKFLTLTYKENMRDTDILLKDLKNFYSRLKTYSKKNSLEMPEYITVVEPQERGCWHAHIILIYKKKAPFIPNADIEKVWGHGFTKTSTIRNDCDNIGVYLTAYLTDMDINEIKSIKILDGVKDTDVKNVTVSENGEKIEKSIIKGLRLKLYPKGLRIYRCSKGILKPVVYKCSYGEVKQLIGKAVKTYEKTISVLDDSETEINRIQYEYYNSKRAAK